VREVVNEENVRLDEGVGVWDDDVLAASIGVHVDGKRALV